jgi:hypothetical protein
MTLNWSVVKLGQISLHFLPGKIETQRIAAMFGLVMEVDAARRREWP